MQSLYDDISQNLDEWAAFVDYNNEDIVKKKEELAEKLMILKRLISEREECFAKIVVFFNQIQPALYENLRVF